MPETTIHGTDNLQQIRKRQFTLSENDMKEMNDLAFLDGQEVEYIEQLNLDKELKAPAPPKVEPVMEEKKPDLDAIKVYFQKCLARQDLINTVASMERDFYAKASLVTNQINETSLFQLDEFISIRLDNIVHHSREYSQNISMKLTEEEVELYRNLCKNVEDFKLKIYKKLGISNR